jgi:hypothetical protein
LLFVLGTRLLGVALRLIALLLVALLLITLLVRLLRRTLLLPALALTLRVAARVVAIFGIALGFVLRHVTFTSCHRFDDTRLESEERASAEPARAP